MKKILFIVAIMFAGISTAMAQTEKGEMGAGLNLLYGTEVGNLGVGAKYRYSIIDEIRAEATVDYLFKHNHQTMFDANINFEYLLPIESAKIVTYPILGVGFGQSHKCCENVDKEFTKEDGSKEIRSVLENKSNNKGIVGINAGWGAEYAVTDKASITVEAQYQFFNKSCTQLLLGVGIVHKF